MANGLGTWTFIGHWGDDDLIHAESIEPGEVEDDREDTGHYEGGLFAAYGEGITQEAAFAEVLAEYNPTQSAETLTDTCDCPEPEEDEDDG